MTNEFREIQNGNRKTAEIDLSKVNIKQAAKLIQQNVNDRNLALELETGKLYVLNANTLSKLMKGLICTGSSSSRLLRCGVRDLRRQGKNDNT